MERQMNKVVFYGILIALLGGGGLLPAADRPNIVWIVSEDNSKHYLKLFDPAGIETPNIARLAEHGLIYDRAFSNAPVCSVARSTLATGCLAPRIGTQFHRKTRLAAQHEDLRMFSWYLGQAGYYTTNNAKKDYNLVEGKGVWNASSRKASWRNRPEQSQPFFHMESHGSSHESSLHFKAGEMARPGALKSDPAAVQLAPYFPDTSTFRFTHARYLDRISAIDALVGRTVKKLEEDGLLEDTFIFYFGDHGGVLPRSKGYVYESGLHVPLVVRIPENWKSLADHRLGTRIQGFVSFIDFGPTTLNLAGVKVPAKMDGKPFLGKGVTAGEMNARDETFGHADRFDEKYEMIRTLRKGKWKYHRNYEAYLPDGLQNNYRYRMLAFSEWRELHRAGKLNPIQTQFFSAKSPEALFDLEKDPHEIHNLAGHPEHTAIKLDMRRRLREQVKALPDLSFFPESVLYAEAMQAPAAYGQAHKDRIGRLVDAADLCLLPAGQRLGAISKALASDDPWIRYWALTAACNAPAGLGALETAVRANQDHEELLVRGRAAVFLALTDKEKPQRVFRTILQQSSNYVETLIAMNDMVFLMDGGLNQAFSFTKMDVKSSGPEVQRRMDYFGWK